MVQSAPITEVNEHFWWACRRYGIRNPDWRVFKQHKGDRQKQLKIYREWENKFLESGEHELLSEFQRTNSLLHVGTALGSNGLAAAFLLLGAGFVHNREVDFYLFGGFLTFALVCIPLGWAKGIQCTHYIVDYHNKTSGKTENQKDDQSGDQPRP